MRGTIGVDSSEGKGSRFHFSIPFQCVGPSSIIAKGEENKPTVLLKTLSVAQRAAKRILLAEDNPLSAKIALRMLRTVGYSGTIWVDDGQKVVEAARATRFDLILMDCQMPVMDGFDATREIRRVLDYHVPIMAVTASSSQDDEKECHESGMDAILLKPFDQVTLVQQMDDILADKEETTEEAPARQ
jgi:CheY-like chemotaxis protein